MKIEEVLAKITVLQHRIEVYRELGACLEEFLPNDTGEDPEPLEVTDTSCITPRVTYEAIEFVLNEVNKLKVSEEEALKALNAMETKDGKSKPAAKRTRKPPAKSKRTTKPKR